MRAGRSPLRGVALTAAIAVTVGLLGALLPAWRAARLPVTAALREA